MKKVLIAAFALASVATSSAFAQTMNDPVRHPVQRNNPHLVNGRYVAATPYADPFLVIENDRVVGRDPDPSIRAQMRRDPVQNEY
jgi:hypothetical protein